MKYFSISRLDDKSYEQIDNNIILVFSNISEYEEEVYDLLYKNNLPLKELEDLVTSWGGKLETIILKDLIKNHVKRNKKNVENRK